MIVYFIQRGKQGPIKIGVSSRLDQRFYQLQKRCADRLSVLGTIKGSFSMELWLHRKFDHLRLDGEWFTPGNELTDYIKENALPVDIPKKDRRRRCNGMTAQGGICYGFAKKGSDYCFNHDPYKDDFIGKIKVFKSYGCQKWHIFNNISLSFCSSVNYTQDSDTWIIEDVDTFDKIVICRNCLRIYSRSLHERA